MSAKTLLGNKWDTMEDYCYRKYKYDIDSYDECCRNYFGRCKEYWRCSCCCRWNECGEQDEECSDLEDEECCDLHDKICIPKSYLPVPCVYPVQCLVLCKNSFSEHFRIYVNDLLGFSLEFRIKQHPYKGTVNLDPNHTGRGSYTPNYDALGFDSFVITVSSTYDHEVIHSVETTIRVRIQECDIPTICDLNCDCCMAPSNSEC